tara:strand:- start:1036 stop:2295 length:1260 start_codon:yes stop_codon:yes gene_type:complete
MFINPNKEITPQQRLIKNVSKIMEHERYQAMAGLMMVGDRRIKKGVPTACTNGRDEWYGEDFIDELNDPELRFVIIHENYHKLYRHLVIYKFLHAINAQVANMACDYVINLKIVKENPDGFAVMPKMGLLDKKYDNMDSVKVFWLLMEEHGDKGKGEGEGEGEGEGQGQGGGDSDREQMPKNWDDHDWEGAKEMTVEEEKELETAIDESIRQGALMAGKTGAGVPQHIKELLVPKVSWKEQFREYFTELRTGKDYGTYSRPNRKYLSTGRVFPSTVSEVIGEIVFTMDSSGSCHGEIPQFVSEFVALCETMKPSAIHLISWDTEPYYLKKFTYEEFANGFDISQIPKPKGGGGTMVTGVPKMIRDMGINPECVINLTDGDLYGQDWGTWDWKTLWCITGSKIFSPVGKTIHINRETTSW